MPFLPIPEFKRYLISKNGIILDNENEIIVQDKEEIGFNSKVKLLYPNRTDRYRSISIARLILTTHKPIENVNLNTIWAPKFINPSIPEINAENLDYDFGDYIPPNPITDSNFYPIPGFIDSLINLKGEVMMNGVLGKLGNQRGYTVASVRLPNGKSVTVGRHRLMALTFLKHPIFCNDLIVNHKNGKPGDDRLENIEWCTYKENIIHSHETGLNKNNFVIEVRNLSNDEIKEYFSIGSFSRFYNLNQREYKRLEFRMRTFGVIQNYRGFSIRKKHEPVPWEEIKFFDKYKGNAKEVIVRNIKTNEIKEFVWFHEAALFLGLSQYVLRNRLQKHKQIIVGDYSVKYGTPIILTGNLE